MSEIMSSLFLILLILRNSAKIYHDRGDNTLC